MKAKFSVEIHTNGNFNDALIRMITNNNAGLVELNFSTITSFIHGKYAEFPTITPVTEMKISYPNKTMEVIEGEGEKAKKTLTISFKEVEEELSEAATQSPTLLRQDNHE